MMLRWNAKNTGGYVVWDARTPLGYYLMRVYQNGKASAASYPQSFTSLKHETYDDQELAMQACEDHWQWLIGEILEYEASDKPYNPPERPRSPNIRVTK